jgi:hypothetical protein
MDGYASKVWLIQNSLGTTQEVEYQRCGKINIMNSLISRGYTSGLINNMDDLSVDSSTVASKKEGKK